MGRRVGGAGKIGEAGERPIQEQWRRLGIAQALLLLSLFCGVGSLRAQPEPSIGPGQYFVQPYPRQAYNGHGQNWGLAQDGQGFLYACNGSGVLQFDGVSWRLIEISNRSTCRSLAVDASGRVFVGAAAELGFLATDALGQLRYESLMEHVPEDDRVFTDVWRAHSLSDGIYFQTNSRLLRWDGHQIQVWSTSDRFRLSHAIRDTLYVTERERGLLRLEGEALVLAPGGDRLAGLSVSGLVPHGDSAFLAMTRTGGIFRCSDRRKTGGCEPFAPELTPLLTETRPNHASLLPDGRIAVGTQYSGALLLDPNGRLLRVLDETSGLTSETVWFTFVDQQGSLWLALNDGLARAEVSSSLTYFDASNGVPETVNSMGERQGRLYVATDLGIVVTDVTAPGPLPRFTAVEGIAGQCWSLLPMPDGMLAACNGGVYNVDRQQLVFPFPGQHVFFLFRSKHDPTQLYVGLQHGLVRMEQRDGGWQTVEQIEGTGTEVRMMAEDQDGRLWLCPRPGELMRLEPPTADGKTKSVRFGRQDGLPSGWIDTRFVAGRMLFLPNGSPEVLELDPQHSSFVPSTFFLGILPTLDEPVTGVIEDRHRRLWITTQGTSGVALPQDDGSYEFFPTTLRRVAELSVFASYVAEDGSFWVGGFDGLIRLASDGILTSDTSFPAWIRRIAASDTLLFDGRSSSQDVPAQDEVVWPYDQNALRFAFAAPSFDAPEKTEYRTRLDGFDDDWSIWSDETDKDYTNLWEGDYVFRVQARDVYGLVSVEDRYAFRIQPPWYRSWWAYGLYVLTLAMMLLLYLRSHRQELQRERLAAERERAVNARLRQVDRLKDEFLANTSHELRTPLYGIAGIVESLIDGATGDLPEATKRNLDLVMTSSRRLSALVDDILDFSKLRHQSLTLDTSSVDLHALVDVVLTLAAPLVGQKDVELENAVAELPPAHADERRLQQILTNLIGNAIKFTEQGQVVVSASIEGEQLIVSVSDTGIGISAEQQRRVFEAFEQADASISRQYGGTGLGLAVTRQLVELHGGSIWLQSVEGEGSTFSFSLPTVADAAVSTFSFSLPTVADAAVETGSTIKPEDRPEAPIDDSVANPLSETSPELAARRGAELDPTAIRAVEPLPSGSPREGEAIRILAVDDEQINLQILQNFLTETPFELVMANGGTQALELLNNQRFDLVLLDVMMPQVSGFEVCRALRQQFPKEQLPVLFLSAKTQASDVVKALSLGANDYLRKPIEKQELLARLAPHLDLLEVNQKLEELVEEKLAHIKVLEGILPICSWCKKIRDEDDQWVQMESYISEHSEADFSHGLCQDCLPKFLAEVE